MELIEVLFILDGLLFRGPGFGQSHGSADGKANATRQALDALCRHFQLEGHYTITPPLPTQPLIQAATLPDALLQIYNPHTDSQALKKHPEWFEQLRGNYPLRREEGAYRISLNDVTGKNAE